MFHCIHNSPLYLLTVILLTSPSSQKTDNKMNCKNKKILLQKKCICKKIQYSAHEDKNWVRVSIKDILVKAMLQIYSYKMN